MGCKRFATFKKFASSLVSQYVPFLPIEVWQVVDCQWLTKRSFDGQVLCQRMLMGPCAETTLGAATAAVARAAPPRNLRRVVGEDTDFFDMHSLHWSGMTFFVIFCDLNHPKA
jgi:hypothetical protein